MASHAAAAARGAGIPAVLGIKTLRLTDDGFSIDGIVVGVGEIIEVDGFEGKIRQ
jgi:phosphoenolpyruvate synthase/pyruvate phosphate dikinase